ncbi:MAG: hypothetical protein DCC60_09740 [Ignavibacteriae bacterium]|nr:MAG: hypothetical protein DCC60_09740 [Ignavibacteriota bacterium]
MSSRKDRFKIYSISFYKIKSNQFPFSRFAVRLQKMALLVLPEGSACDIGVKANVPFACWHKISKYFVRRDKKYRRVGKECLPTRCPFEIW